MRDGRYRLPLLNACGAHHSPRADGENVAYLAALKLWNKERSKKRGRAAAPRAARVLVLTLNIVDKNAAVLVLLSYVKPLREQKLAENASTLLPKIARDDSVKILRRRARLSKISQ